jgi:hypothetical protein
MKDRSLAEMKGVRKSDRPDPVPSITTGQRRRLSHDLDAAAAEPSI